MGERGARGVGRILGVTTNHAEPEGLGVARPGRGRGREVGKVPSIAAGGMQEELGNGVGRGAGRRLSLGTDLCTPVVINSVSGVYSSSFVTPTNNNASLAGMSNNNASVAGGFGREEGRVGEGEDRQLADHLLTWTDDNVSADDNLDAIDFANSTPRSCWRTSTPMPSPVITCRDCVILRTEVRALSQQVLDLTKRFEDFKKKHYY